ncbi:origin recognition complex subunit 6 [Erpetoichthys calabaricus]|uniref:Origin recognition complex subunit 6 n=1 Tax=Erpetoichthys calabaricus TaxID=27687 RepID=A0A8C4S8Y0_ERPCA|nr:origin recognition complex subunit 6 [Erpetoichthys calabaricus]
MEQELIKRLATKMGIGSANVITKAEEYHRLSQVRCMALSTHTTATSDAVMCLELAALRMKQPVDKDYVVKLSGLNKKIYQNRLRSLEMMLGLNSQTGIRDLAVQHGCMEAINMAVEILQRYESSLSEAQQNDLDLSRPLFTTAALFTACKCMKMKADKTKLVAASGAKKGIFDRLCTLMEKFGQQRCSELEAEKKTAKPVSKRQQTFPDSPLDNEGEGITTKQKQQKTEVVGSTKPDYEEWKRKILANAEKARKADV